MQRSSSSIASLAAALARAQAVLVNPEKSLLGTMPPERPGGSERSFRYASLASGLDIVRKTLGEHEIAMVQTTAIDQSAGIVNLTTMLAHSSGEWIASDWPVCPVTETEVPHRMGAALTYARRYALFTLVGIAGEDDLDAPDLLASSGHGSASEEADRSTSGQSSIRPSRSPAGNGKAKTSPSQILGLKVSAERRDQLVAQIAEIGSADDAALWAYCNMRAKNGLTTGDAHLVEKAFQTKLAGFADKQGGPSSEEEWQGELGPQDPYQAAAPADSADAKPFDSADAKPSAPPVQPKRVGATRSKSVAGIDKAVLAFPEPRRIRDREHVRFVAQKPCLVCGRRPSDPHHLRFAQSSALGRKVSDEFTVPLCRGHHREVHRFGDEASWWQSLGIDSGAIARSFWVETHPQLEANKTGDDGDSVALNWRG